MTTAVIAAVATIGGVLLGSLLGRSAEYSKWYRTEGHSACAQLLARIEDARLAQNYNLVTKAVIDRHLVKDLMEHPDVRAAIDRRALEVPAAGGPAEPDRVAQAKAGRLLRDQFGMEPADWLQSFKNHTEQVNAALQSVRLLCPPDVAAAAVALSGAYQRLGYVRDIDGWEEADASYFLAREVYVYAARTFLHPRRFRRP